MMFHALSRTTRIASRRLYLLKPQTASAFHSSSLLASDLPYHIVVGLPALSPTMESGALAEWYVAEGDSFSAGDVIAKIETDKASIDFEAQDDGNVAKLLLDAPTSDIAVGSPIMITVEEAEDVAAFKDYVHTAAEPEPAAPVEEAPKAAEPAPAPPVEKAATPPPPPPPAAEPVAAPTPPPAAPPAAAPVASPEFAIAWGLGATAKSPLAKTLATKQKAYLELYGTTGQRPLM